MCQFGVGANSIRWRDGKNRQKPAVLIEWSPELSATIDEAIAIKRNSVAGTMFVFGNMRGQRYTKGGWKAMLDDLMREREKAAAERRMALVKFSLQDCRPKGVSDKLERGDTDTQDATLHSNAKMVETIYDRRKSRKATPAASRKYRMLRRVIFQTFGLIFQIFKNDSNKPNETGGVDGTRTRDPRRDRPVF